MGSGGFPHRVRVVQWRKVLTTPLQRLLLLLLLLLLAQKIPGGAQSTGCTHCHTQHRLLLLLLKLEEGVNIGGRGG